MSLLARWHLRRAAEYTDAAVRWDRLAAGFFEADGLPRVMVADQVIDASLAWVRAVECLLYAARLP